MLCLQWCSLGEDERNLMSEMHAVTAWATAGVKVEGFALLEAI
jgi:hypothetical protein